MANAPDTLTTLLKTVIKHEQMLSIILGAVTDHACMLENGLKRCMSEGCKEPMTVRHVAFGLCVCDHHAARAMTLAKSLLTDDVTDVHNAVRRSIMHEDSWHDVEDAERIRKIREFILVVKQREEASPPQHLDELH